MLSLRQITQLPSKGAGHVFSAHLTAGKADFTDNLNLACAQPGSNDLHFWKADRGTWFSTPMSVKAPVVSICQVDFGSLLPYVIVGYSSGHVSFFTSSGSQLWSGQFASSPLMSIRSHDGSLVSILHTTRLVVLDQKCVISLLLRELAQPIILRLPHDTSMSDCIVYKPSIPDMDRLFTIPDSDQDTPEDTTHLACTSGLYFSTHRITRSTADDFRSSPFSWITTRRGTLRYDLERLYDIRDDGRRGVSINPCPWNTNLVAVTDNIARVSLILVDTGIIISMLKGYRDAQTAWLANRLLVHAPRRCQLETWCFHRGVKIHALKVPSGSTLVPLQGGGALILQIDGSIYEVQQE